MWCWMIDIDEDDMYVFIRVGTENLHELDCLWYIDDMIGDWKTISVRNRQCVCYLNGWRVCVFWDEGKGQAGASGYEDGVWNCVFWYKRRGRAGADRYEDRVWDCMYDT